MDLDHLERLISKIDLKEQTIRTIAQYCIINSKDSEVQIGRIIDKQFPTYYNQKMLALILLVSQIFLRTWEKKDNRFFKPLAPKSKVYIQEISKRYKQIKPEHINIIPGILANWSKPGKELFAFSFMDKLRKIAEPIIMTANRLQEQKKNNLFQNYSKTFLMEYEDIRSYEPTSRIYDIYVGYEKIAVQIGQINTQIKKLGLAKMTPQIALRAAQLRKTLQKFTQKLQQIICKCHVDFKLLRQNCRIEFDKLPAQAKQILQKETD